MDKTRPASIGHLPVLLAEVVAAVQPAAGARIVDATFGGGGYARAFLQAADCSVIGVDRDPDAVARGRVLEGQSSSFKMLEGCFGDLPDLLLQAGLLDPTVPSIDAIVADLGVSSFQLDQAERGFAFSHEGPLDMRMDRHSRTAAELLADIEQAELARILRLYGDEPQAGRVSRAILRRQAEDPILTTSQLRDVVGRAKGGRKGARIDPATQAFQALRIAVNDELGELERLLKAAAGLLKPGGRLVLVTFHSGEDRIVKRFVDEAGGKVTGRSRHLPPVTQRRPVFAWAKRGVTVAAAGETATNPRARSAKLRVAIRQADDATEDGPLGRDARWRMAA
ncbi:16S rRNA (cytosine1402-N4)-methyltransferase [Arboricoccus pini]|uniref:Ribosomal RNA small subunit methyltransferase H n=1 Tax=Arboricoccus pini TaxID=1963835 RepID=A0A212Q9T7_9PROT|nr:16S rRNA (cytosine(1402)-N(4))-methyltransferase RsmH [Arboricoccus pini]SNB56123.1 16S rRNA (cytosine1402-N4)-methyltransferase [Arboricoccus pini]